MSFNMIEFIETKKESRAHAATEIAAFLDALIGGSIADYQVAAWLMAVRLNGMNEDEITFLTGEMAKRGKYLDLSGFDNVVDKHSTGGVGDKTTLVSIPLAASVGATVIKFSGRTLGFTGGTIDKLESIPGFRTSISIEDIKKQARSTGLVIVSATSEMVPADKILYSIRDVTSTIDSIPLIAASILSKKIASGAKNIIFDVKFGDGAFMDDTEQASELAQTLVRIAQRLGRKSRAVLSSMEIPLGLTVGNTLEVVEAIETLKGKGPEDLLDLSTTIAAEMVVLAKGKANRAQIKKELARSITKGKALEKFKEMIEAQGGDARVIDDYELMPHANFRYSFKAPKDGYIDKIPARIIGNLVRSLGGGRFKRDDHVDHAVGVKFAKKTGDQVEEGENILDVFYNDVKHKEMIEKIICEAISVCDNPVEIPELIQQVI